MLETHPTRGTFIRPLSLLDLQELYRIRYAIEGLAAFLAAERGPGEELISYVPAFQTAFDAPETFDIAEVHDHGVEFHFGVRRRRKSQAAGDVPPFPLFEAAPPEAFFSVPQNDRTKLLLNQILH